MESISSDWHLLNNDDWDSTGSPMSEDESCLDQLEAMVAEAEKMQSSVCSSNSSGTWGNHSSQSFPSPSEASAQSYEYEIEQQPGQSARGCSHSSSPSPASTSWATQPSVCGDGSSVYGHTNSSAPSIVTSVAASEADVDSCSTDSEDECGIGFVRINGSSLIKADTFDGGSGEHDCIDAPTGCDDVITKTASAALDKTSSPSGTGDTQDTRQGDDDVCAPPPPPLPNGELEGDRDMNRRILHVVRTLNGWLLLGTLPPQLCTGRGLVAVILVALLSVAISSLIAVEKKNAEIEEMQQNEALKESRWMRDMEQKIGEQLQLFNSQMQQERDQWQSQLDNSNALMEELKAKLSKSEALNKLRETTDENSDRSILGWIMGPSDELADENAEDELIEEATSDQDAASIGNNINQIIEELSQKYSISSADKLSLQQILQKRQTSNQENSGNQESSWDDAETIMAQSLAATKAFLENSLKSLQNSIREANFTTEALSSGKFVNVSEVIRVSETMGNAVFELVAEKISQIADLKENLNMSQVEEFATAQAKNTVHKMNSIVNKTVEKLSKVRDEVESNKQVRKLKKGAGKVFNEFMKGLGEKWKDFSKLVSGSFFKKKESRYEESRSFAYEEQRFERSDSGHKYQDNEKPFWKKKSKENRHERHSQHFHREEEFAQWRKHRNNARP